MTKLEDMTEEEQQAWWMKQAHGILEQHFGLFDAEVEWLAYTHNAVFDVKLEEHHRVLHLYKAETMSWDRLVALVEWLHKLRTEADLMVSTVDWHMGKPQIGNVFGLEQISCAALFLHVDGETRTAKNTTTSEIQQVGQFLGKMHAFSTLRAKGLSHSVSFPRLDYNGLFSSTGMYYPGGEAMRVFTDEQVLVMDAVAERVKAAMDELGQGKDEFGLIHGDLLLKNILFHEGEVRALDFEYCGWGYYLYDLTPVLWQLKPQAGYPQLEQALWEGYTAVRELSARHRGLLETFIAGRQVASMRWVAANQHNPAYRGKVSGILAQRTAELQNFLDTGMLMRS